MKTFIKVTECKYRVEIIDGIMRVYCHLKCDLQLSRALDYLTISYKDFPNGANKFEIEAFTTLRGNDIFDYRTGCKIAHSKAELKAYNYANKVYDNLYIKLNKMLDTVYLRSKNIKCTLNTQLKYIDKNVIEKDLY